MRRPVAFPSLALLLLACVSLIPVSLFPVGCGQGPAGCGQGPRGSSPPNVLLVTVDTLRADRLGAYGFPLATSPNIDALAASGVVFERAIAGAASTAPSHASILTSRYTRQHSIGYVTGDTRLEGVTSVADVFRAAGYATAAFVGNVNLKRRSGLDRGFDVYDDELTELERNRRSTVERTARNTTERVLTWLADAGDGPFFLWVHYQDPHGPYTPPAAYRGRIQLPLRAGERPLPVLGDNTGYWGIPRYQSLPGLSLASEYEGRYADEIFYADRWIGELVEAVDARSTERGAVVLFTADHGESMGEDGRFFVHVYTPMPNLAHVPLILRAPGLAPGRRADPVHHVDAMPTLLELAGLEIPAGTSGLALAPFLRAGGPLPERRVYCDNGGQLGAYGRDGIVRVQGLGWLWPDAGKPRVEPRWSRYAWNEDGTWSLVERDAKPDEAIREYFLDVVPMKREGLSDEQVRQLEALGYAEP